MADCEPLRAIADERLPFSELKSFSEAPFVWKELQDYFWICVSAALQTSPFSSAGLSNLPCKLVMVS